MLSEVQVITSQGTTLTMELGVVANGIALSEVEGLDPVKATIVSSSFAAMDGTQYHASRREDRNIKLKILLEPDYATEGVRDVRKRLYGFLMPKAAISLLFTDSDGSEVIIDGRVESFESALFSRDPAVDVSVICFDPDFTDPEIVTVSGDTVEDATTFNIDYAGDVESGITFVLLPDRSITEFTITNDSAVGVLQRLDFASPLLAGDQLTIRTVPGDKFVNLNRGGFDIPLLYGVTPQSSWIQLDPGDNAFRVYAEGDPIPYNIYYFTKYGGL